MNMKLLLCAVLTLSSVLSTNIAYGDKAAQTTVFKTERPKVILLGDSLAQGMSHEFQKIAKKNGYSPVILAKGGTWCNYWSGSIERIVTKHHPQIVIVSLGTNDSTSSKPEPQRLHIKKIREKVVDSGAKLLWLTPPQLPKRFKSKDEIRSILSEEIPPEETFTGDDLQLEKEKDKIHMTVEGYKKWITSTWNIAVEKGLFSPKN